MFWENHVPAFKTWWTAQLHLKSNDKKTFQTSCAMTQRLLQWWMMDWSQKEITFRDTCYFLLPAETKREGMSGQNCSIQAKYPKSLDGTEEQLAQIVTYKIIWGGTINSSTLRSGTERNDSKSWRQSPEGKRKCRTSNQ